MNLNTENGNERLIAVEVDLFLEGFPIVALPDGRPNCLLNPRFRFRNHSQFWFLPTGCAGADCAGVHGSLVVDAGEQQVQRFFVCHFSLPESTEYGNYVAISASAQGIYESFERPLVIGGRLFDGRGIVSVREPQRPCCGVHASKGCEDYDCERCVCELDPPCCADLWDATCADEAAHECAEACDRCTVSCGGDCRGDGKARLAILSDP